MSKVKITDDVILPTGIYTVVVTVSNTGCTVTIPESARPIEVSWETMEDVEALSEIFGNTTVRMFKSIVKLLGKVYKGREAFKE